MYYDVNPQFCLNPLPVIRAQATVVPSGKASKRKEPEKKGKGKGPAKKGKK